MARIERFEDIQAWQKARELTRAVYAVSADRPFRTDFALRDQIRRAAVSAMANIAEGFGRGGRRELVRFLHISKGSLAEVQALLYVALDAGHVEQDEFNALYRVSADTMRLVGGFIHYLKTK